MSISAVNFIMLGALLVSSAGLAQGVSQSPASQRKGAKAPLAAPARSPYLTTKMPKHAREYYSLYGGVDNLRVRETGSGNLIRFSYRITDPARAKILGDKSASPSLIGIRSRAVLQIPVMDKVGQLRQSGAPESGQEYWMVFSNKGNLIKAGDRVNVVIGSFHVDGLLVE